MPSYYKYSNYSTPSGGVRRTSVSRTSYSSNSGDPNSSYKSSYSYSDSYSSKTGSSSEWKSNNNGLVTSYSGTGKDIFDAISNAEKAKGFKDQDYNKLKDNCRRSGRLFEDSAFPADNRSLFFSQASPRKFEWKRPGVTILHFVCLRY